MLTNGGTLADMSALGILLSHPAKCLFLPTHTYAGAHTSTAVLHLLSPPSSSALTVVSAWQVAVRSSMLGLSLPSSSAFCRRKKSIT